MIFLITGVAGFIGSHLGLKILAQGHKLIGLDNLDDYYDVELKKCNLDLLSSAGGSSFEFHRGDILDRGMVEKLCRGVDCVYHLAAKVGVRASMEDPQSYMTTNVNGTDSVVGSAVRASVGRIIVASSSSVYGGNEKVPFSESDRTDKPISFYAASKKAAEHVCRVYHDAYGANVNCLRFFTVYGPRQRPEMAIARFTRNIADGKAIKVFGDGKSARDYTFVDDIVSGAFAAMNAPDGFNIFNLGGSHPVKLMELIEIIETALKRKAILEFEPLPPGDVVVTSADISLAGRLLGYSPQTSIEQGIAAYVDWYMSRKESA